MIELITLILKKLELLQTEYPEIKEELEEIRSLVIWGKRRNNEHSNM